MIVEKEQAIIVCQYMMRVLSVEGGFWRVLNVSQALGAKRPFPTLCDFRANLHTN